MEIEENVNPGAEKWQISKIPFENRKNMQFQIVVYYRQRDVIMEVLSNTRYIPVICPFEQGLSLSQRTANACSSDGFVTFMSGQNCLNLIYHEPSSRPASTHTTIFTQASLNPISSIESRISVPCFT